MVERVWNEFGAFVHQQIIWVKSRPVLTYSLYLWQHEPCLFGWIRGREAKDIQNGGRRARGRVSDYGLGGSEFRSRDRRASDLQAVQALHAADGDAHRARRHLL